VYGELQHVPADERHPIVPRDPYGASKASFELYLGVYAVNYGLTYCTFRYPNVYGPRQDPFGEAGVVSIFTGQMLRGVQPVINGSGQQERDYVYVDDVARANVLALTGGDNQAFNLGSGVGVSVNTIFSELKGMIDAQVPEVHGPAKLGEVERSCLDATKADRELGWRPQVDLKAGLAKTVEYFRPLVQPKVTSRT
jgi:UDP-glucose 4-epimerase